MIFNLQLFIISSIANKILLKLGTYEWNNLIVNVKLRMNTENIQP